MLYKFIYKSEIDYEIYFGLVLGFFEQKLNMNFYKKLVKYFYYEIIELQGK